MFDSCSTRDLSVLLSQFHVPMFAAQRASRAHPFKIICINPALEKAAGLCASAVEGAILEEILPKNEAQQVAARYEACARSQQDLRYFETLTLPKGEVRWDTSLQFVPLKSGGERIIGTAFKITNNFRRPELDDIRYLSSVADLQLRNFVTLLDAEQQEGLFCADSAQRVERLAALCRGVERAIDDIRTVVRRAEQENTAGSSRPETSSVEGIEDAGGCTLAALLSASTEQD